MDNIVIVNCPTCNMMIEIIEMNCRQFVCGILKSNYLQINPHSDELICKELKDRDLIYGCGQAFEIDHEGRVKHRHHG